MTSQSEWLALAAEIARMPGVPQRLLDAHRPDPFNMCHGCTTPGFGTRWRPWPCAIYTLAADALRTEHSWISGPSV